MAIILVILLFACKLALVASFYLRLNMLLNFKFKNEANMANLQARKRMLKQGPFWNKVPDSAWNVDRHFQYRRT